MKHGASQAHLFPPIVRTKQPSQAPNSVSSTSSERDAARWRTTPTKRTRDWADYNRRRRAVSEWRARYGNVCPGYKRPPHPANDLTAEHVHAVAETGDASGRLTVLCRACNSRHGAETALGYRT